MTISLHRTLKFNNLFDLAPNQKKFELVFRNDINQALCGLRFLAINSACNPPLFVAIKIQTTFDENQMQLETPSSSLNIDFRTFFPSQQCIPFNPPPSTSGFFTVTLTFNRELLAQDGLFVSPINCLGNVVIA